MNSIKQFSVLSILLLLFSFSSLLAQQSDYQITQNYKAELEELQNKVDAATTTDELLELEAEFDAFRSQYSEHSDIINSSIFPETFDMQLSNLQESYDVSMESASVIEQLNSRIENLEAEIDGFRDQVTSLNQETRSLMEQIERSEQNERSQAALLRQYRQNLEERDSFVSDFLEQLMNRYQNIDLSSQRELREASERLDDNPLEVLRTLILEYINLADESTGLDAPDYIAMRAQHGYFLSVWNRIGTNLTNTFSQENSEQAKQEVDDLLITWLRAIDNRLWKTLDAAFASNGFVLDTFSSEDEFYDAVYSFVDNAHVQSLESNSEADFNRYSEFKSFWENTVKAEWGSYLIEGDILSQAQITEIDIKIDQWGDAAEPTSNLMFILLIVSIAVIVGLIVLLITKKN